MSRGDCEQRNKKKDKKHEKKKHPYKHGGKFRATAITISSKTK